MIGAPSPSRPLAFSPQHQAVPSVLIAQACSQLPSMSLTPEPSPVGVTGMALSSAAPLPSSVLLPQHLTPSPTSAQFQSTPATISLGVPPTFGAPPVPSWLLV